MGLEPMTRAWKAIVLPLHHARMVKRMVHGIAQFDKIMKAPRAFQVVACRQSELLLRELLPPSHLLPGVEAMVMRETR